MVIMVFFLVFLVFLVVVVIAVVIHCGCYALLLVIGVVAFATDQAGRARTQTNQKFARLGRWRQLLQNQMLKPLRLSEVSDPCCRIAKPLGAPLPMFRFRAEH